jgi:hypothetical protein
MLGGEFAVLLELVFDSLSFGTLALLDDVFD